MTEKTITDVKNKVETYHTFGQIIMENINALKDIKPKSKELSIVMYTAYVKACLRMLKEYIASKEFKGILESHYVDDKSNVPPDVFIKHLLAHLDEYTNKVTDLIIETGTENLFDLVHVLSKVVNDELDKL